MAVELGTMKFDVLFFGEHGSPYRYVVGLGDVGYQEFIRRYDSSTHKRVSHYGLDDFYEDHFWLCWVDGCFDPPMAVVRATAIECAQDMFVDEFPWARLDDEDVPDLSNPNVKDNRTITTTGQGVHFNSESVCVRQVHLLEARNN